MKNNKPPKISYSEDLKNYLFKLAAVQIPKKNKDFQKKTETFRNKWGIPPKGFTSPTWCQEWFKKPPAKILKRPKAVEQIEKEIIHLGKNKKIIKKWIPFFAEGLQADKKIRKFPLGSFLTDVDRFMIENSIDEAIKEIFFYFFYYNKYPKKFIRKYIVEVAERLVITRSRQKVNHTLTLAIGPNTRQKDIEAIWSKFVQPLQKTLPGYCAKKTRYKKVFKNLSNTNNKARTLQNNTVISQ